MEEIRATGRSPNPSNSKAKSTDAPAAQIRPGRQSSRSSSPGEDQSALQENSIERVTEQTNAAITNINGQIDNAQQVAGLNRNASREAKKLEKLLKQKEDRSDSESDSDIEATIQRLEKLDREREALERDIEIGNSNKSGIQKISSGSQQIGEVRVKPVELQQRNIQGSSIKSSEDARNFIAQNRTENASLRSQINDLRIERQGAAELGSEARKQVRRLPEGDAESLDLRSAEALAQSVAQEIRAMGAELQAVRSGQGNNGATINPITEVFQSPDTSKIIQKLRT